MRLRQRRDSTRASMPRRARKLRGRASPIDCPPLRWLEHRQMTAGRHRRRSSPAERICVASSEYSKLCLRFTRTLARFQANIACNLPQRGDDEVDVLAEVYRELF